MNKKFLFGMFAAAGMLLATSCQNDELDLGQSGNEATVSFTLGVEGGVQTRAAISDGLTVNELVWEVYDKNGTKVEAISSKETAFNGSLNHTIDLTLAKGQTYTFAFWAHNATSGIYNTEDLRAVTMNYSGVDGNDEGRDAFFAFTDPITITGDFTEKITLKRPFAQLNLGVSDLEDFQKAGIDLKNVAVKVSDVASSFNVSDGSVTGGGQATFNLADILYNDGVNTTLALNTPIDGETEFPWISMNYLLVNAAATDNYKTTVGVEFTLKTTHDDIVLGSANTPVQRNYRTNIIASLTSVGKFNIVIDPMFDGEYVEGAELVYDGVASTGENSYEIFSAEGLKNASENLLTSAETEDVELNIANDIEVTAGSMLQTHNATVDLTIDGGNNTFTTVVDAEDLEIAWNYIAPTSTSLATENGKTVTVSDLTFAGEMTGVLMGNAQQQNCNVVMNDVSIVDVKAVELIAGVAPAACAYGQVTLNNCNIYNTLSSDYNAATVAVYDVTVANKASLNVVGGKIGTIYTWANTKITISENAEVSNLILPGNMNTNAKITITSNAKVDVINLSKVTNAARVPITVEDGATVGKYLWGGNEYTSLEDVKAAISQN